MRPRWWLLGCAYVAMWVGLAPTLGHAEVRKIATVEGITEYQLDNGLKVLLFPDPSRPTVTVNLTVFVGSRHEGYGESGMAHLLEHMLFKGTPTHPNIPKALADRGARFNGTTWVDRTNYWETLPASDDNLEFAIRLEADRLVNSLIRREDLASEMTVVRNEFEMGENDPTNILSQRMLAVAYEWHNYGKATIGNRSDIERVPVENLREFYRRYYQPDNALLIVAGQFDENKALQWIEKYFGALPRPARKLSDTYTEEPPQDGERCVVLRRVGDVQLVGLVYHICAGAHPDFVAVDVLNQILTETPSGRLYKALVETKKAASVFGNAYAFREPGIIEILVTVPKNGNLEEVKDIMLQEVEGVLSKPPTDEEVERAKQQLLREWELAWTNSQRMAIQLSDWAAQGDWRLFFVYRDRVEKVTPKEVREVAARYLRRNNRTLGMFIPTAQPERVAIPAAPDVAALVRDYKGRDTLTAGEAFDVSPENIEKRVQRKQWQGIQGVLLPKKTRGQTVHLTLRLRFGTAETLKPYGTASDFLGPLMRRGTRTLSYQQLQDELDKARTRLSISSDVGQVTVTMQTTRPNLARALELLRHILREPALSDQELEILKRQHIAALEEQLKEPQALALRTLRRQLNPYPVDDVRYVPTVEEEIARVRALRGEEIRRLYQEFLGSQAGELALVGDFDPESVNSQLAALFDGWQAPQPYARIPRPALDTKPGRQVIITPDKANAVYMAGLVFPLSDNEPEYPALVLGDYILGNNTLASRLGDRIREKEGLSYGVGSRFNALALDKRASFLLYAIYNPQNRERVEALMLEEIEKLRKEGVTEEEVKRAKQGWLQQQRVTRTNDANLANILAELAYEGRTMQYYQELEKHIAQLTPQQIHEAMRKYLVPGKLYIVVAGDFPSTGKPAAP
ncbi:MAG: insulinase family protein [Gemmatales bacterium]|nr:insulinase family protein [Gemmatales bacterium]MDW8221434.1 pitrilysin family protein [Gemmatales bacterium]